MPRAAKSTSSRRHAGAAPLVKHEGVTTNETKSTPATSIFGHAAPAPLPTSGPKPFHGAIAAGAAAHPYSRSHLRREKRKVKQQIAGGLDSVALALAEVTGEREPEVPVPGSVPKGKPAKETPPQTRQQEVDGKIGAGTKKTLGEKQRRRQIVANTIRNTAVSQHPAFKANPWSTIREHAQNSLATAEAVADVTKRKEEAKRKIAQRQTVSMNGVE